MTLSDYRVFCVFELNDYVSRLLKRDPVLQSIRVKGEISGFKQYYSSGHWYFSIKDEQSKIDCAMFRSYNSKCSFIPADGTDVIVTGYIDLYTRDGKYQLIVTSMRPGGVGDLYQQFQELKNKLMAQGLFEKERKKQLPYLPKKIAVITSESGAVYHDIVKVCKQRNPSVPIVLVPSSVQGKGAQYELSEAVKKAENLPDIDLIIIGRGGGSAEDLQCFNKQILARTIYACHIPIISAVGHETDFTICDFVADCRASTPSNAAQLAVPQWAQIRNTFCNLRNRLVQVEKRYIEEKQWLCINVKRKLEKLGPESRLIVYRNRLDYSRKRLTESELFRINNYHDKLNHLELSLESSFELLYQNILHTYVLNRDRIRAFSPFEVLKRGYTIVSDAENSLITSTTQIKDRMKITFHDGTVNVNLQKGKE